MSDEGWRRSENDISE